jgi:RNA polymerase sigma-70 factor, ECF subfamily
MIRSAAIPRPASETVQTQDDRARFERDAIPYMRQMFPAALRLTRDRCDAEDLIQETFARAYVKFHLFCPGTNLRAWLHRIMFHTFYSSCRKLRSAPAELPTGCLGDDTQAQQRAVPAARSAEAEALDNMAASPVMRALRELPECFRTAIFLADVEGYQYHEIADIMATPIGTVMSRIHRGRRMLRQRLRSSAARPAQDRRLRVQVAVARGPLGAAAAAIGREAPSPATVAPELRAQAA